MSRSTLTMTATATAALFGLAACGGGSGGGDGELSGASISVGGKDFTEQLVLCEMTVLALEDAGADVTNSCNLQGTVAAREALLAGEIDTYWEYTGTGWITHLGNAEPIQEPDEQFTAVAEADLEQNQIEWLPYAPFNNTYAFAANQATIEETGIETLSDLAEANNAGEPVNICVESEFAVRNDGLPGLQEVYGTTFSPDQISELATGAIYSATGGDECQFGEVFITDGRIVEQDLTVLEDDLAFFPIYNPSPNVRAELLEEFPAIADVFAPITEALDNDTMTALNAQVDVDGETADAVAEEWLESEGLIG
ncbi:glycine betaine ABC transporter substrate-binding protein [Aquipuribacter sp. MA13-6]|uniref:glycine betaine ABC transporter substrate-binding protein n=1 Tax=unclassified Aquipuribacter TaxID=2635084 RepID=UPI003EE98051